MAASFGRTRRLARLSFALSIALAVAGVAESAHAQGFFDFLRGLFGGYRPPPPQQQIGPPLPSDREMSETPRKADGTYAAYCVRLCDGRYFPLPVNAGAPSSSPLELCSSMCPATKTEVYTGSGIDQAVSSRGKPYASLPNAFAYREQLADDCSCTGSGALGLAKIDVRSDPTLRPGDIVVHQGRPRRVQGRFAPAASDQRVRTDGRRQKSAASPASLGDACREHSSRAEEVGRARRSAHRSCRDKPRRRGLLRARDPGHSRDLALGLARLFGGDADFRCGRAHVRRRPDPRTSRNCPGTSSRDRARSCRIRLYPSRSSPG